MSDEPWVMFSLRLTDHGFLYPVVLVGGDSHEASLREGEGAEVPVSVYVAVRRRIHVHHVEARLVAMHGA